jgi:hypothetical protein
LNFHDGYRDGIADDNRFARLAGKNEHDPVLLALGLRRLAAPRIPCGRNGWFEPGNPFRRTKSKKRPREQRVGSRNGSAGMPAFLPAFPDIIPRARILVKSKKDRNRCEKSENQIPLRERL